MKIQSTAFTVMAALLVFSVGLFGNANAAPRVCEDGTRPPCDGGGGGDGGGAAPDFGDLIILYRDDNGVPYPSAEVPVQDPDGATVDGGLCWQPIAFNVSDEDGTVCPLSCVEDGPFPSNTDVVVVDVNQYSCGVEDGCSGCTQEVEFGRINAARSPDEVFDRQLEDVVINLSIADCVTLDPAGRLVANVVDDTTLDNLAKTIDSPLQNLAIYKELMLTGFIGTAPGIDLPDDNIYNTAARGLGAGSDKSGGVNVDLVSYLNQIMGLSDPATPTVLGKLCETYREEVQGVVQEVEKCYLNYGTDQSDIEPAGADYAYNRATNFLALPNPAYIPELTPTDGWFEYLAVVDPLAEPADAVFRIEQGLIQDAVFCVDGAGNPLDPVFATLCTSLPLGDPTGNVEQYDGENIGAFAQASDDARAVISFMHSWQVPVGYETPLPCDASDKIFYDLAISEQSGLQVPTKYVNNKEREFFVNVTNNGPDPANGTVTVVATANGESIDCGVADCTWILEPIVELPAGQTESFTVFFTINTTSDTIDWTATVAADPPGTDPVPSNDSRDAISTVSNPGGGGVVVTADREATRINHGQRYRQ